MMAARTCAIFKGWTFEPTCKDAVSEVWIGEGLRSYLDRETLQIDRDLFSNIVCKFASVEVSLFNCVVSSSFLSAACNVKDLYSPAHYQSKAHNPPPQPPPSHQDGTQHLGTHHQNLAESHQAHLYPYKS